MESRYFCPSATADYNAAHPLAGQLLDDDIRISEISRVLDEAGVPNVLWAENMLYCYGVPTMVWGVDFIVPDDLVSKAYDALTNVGFVTCLDASTCLWYDPTKCHGPFPAEHLHAPLDPYIFGPRSDNEEENTLIRFHRKSNILFSFPDIPFGAPAPDDIYYMNADSPELSEALPMCLFRPGVYPIKIPRVTKLFEALLFLRSRDMNDDEDGDQRWVSRWENYIVYLSMYVKDKGLFKKHELDKRFKPAFRGIMYGPNDDGETYVRVLKEIRARLIRDNALPPPPRPHVDMDPGLLF